MNHQKANDKVVTFGEVLLRLTTPGYSRFQQAHDFTINYGGAEANVAVSLSQFGIPAQHITRFPDHDIGHAANDGLLKHGVDMKDTIFGDGRMGIYFMENGAMHRSSRIIYDRFDSAFSKIKRNEFDWEEILKDAQWFHYTGITPAISQGAADACLQAIQAARKLGVIVSGDINYRRNLWQYGKSAQEIMPELISLTDVVIAGITDMENCAGVTGDTYSDACKNMQHRFPAIKKIATTVRESISASHNKISAIMWNSHELIQSKNYDLNAIVDRIGTGDAFMAGLAYGLIKKKNDQQALEFATAACVWKHSVEGDVNRAGVSEIEDLVKGENVGKLLR